MSLDVLNALKLSSNRPKPTSHKSWMQPLERVPDRYCSEKGMIVLDCLTANRGRWFTFNEIVNATGLTRSVARHTSPYLWQLCQLGKLERRDVPNPRGGLPIVQYRVKP